MEAVEQNQERFRAEEFQTAFTPGKSLVKGAGENLATKVGQVWFLAQNI